MFSYRKLASVFANINRRLLSTKTLINSNNDGNQDILTKRIWPRQGDPKIVSVLPPVSTSIFDISKACLIKDFFKGKLHLELLEYPELESKEQVDALNKLNDEIKKFILKFDSTTIDSLGDINLDNLELMRNFGLFGLHINKAYNGSGFNVTQWIRLCEAIGLDSSISTMITAHHSMTAKIIELYGTEDQKLNILSSLSTGQQIGAYCLSEIGCGNDIQSMTTEARFDGNTNQYDLNGSKSWVTNGSIANIFLVFARTMSGNISSNNNSNNNSNNITAFIVDRSGSKGVHIDSKLDTMGIRGANISEIHFDHVRIPVENVLGEVGAGVEIAEKIQHLCRMDIVATCVGQLRYLLSYISEHCLQKHQFGKPIGDYYLVQEKLSKMVMNLYATESAIFYFARLLDFQPSRDLSLELSALKIFATESLNSSLADCIQITGRLGLLKSVPFERYFRDSLSQMMHGGSNDVLRIKIAGAGLLSILPDVQKSASQLRRFVKHPLHTINVLYQFRTRRSGSISSKVGAGIKVTEGGASTALNDHVHPSFKDISQRLAHNVLRFQNFTEATLRTFGKDVVNEQKYLATIADCATDLMLVSICLGRASRSIGIGVHLNDYEISVVNAFAHSAFQRIENCFKTSQELHQYQHRVASELLSHRCYPVNHPSTRVW